jgi:ComF family protein
MALSGLRALVDSGIGAMRHVADPLLTALLAPCCAACGDLLDHPTLGPVCQRCWQAIRPLTPPLCDRCGDSLRTWRMADLPLHACARCRRGGHTVDRGRAIGAYDGPLRAIVHALKYDGRRSLARPLAALMRIRGAEMLTNADCVVPVPLHPARRRQRGFNQAADLASGLGMPVRRLLCRTRMTSAQAALPAAKRHANVRNAFALTRSAHGQGLRGLVVVLVDDVSTTGATLDACARVLKRAGTGEVRALTAARVVGLPR